MRTTSIDIAEAERSDMNTLRSAGPRRWTLALALVGVVLVVASVASSRSFAAPGSKNAVKLARKTENSEGAKSVAGDLKMVPVLEDSGHWCTIFSKSTNQRVGSVSSLIDGSAGSVYKGQYTNYGSKVGSYSHSGTAAVVYDMSHNIVGHISGNTAHAIYKGQYTNYGSLGGYILSNINIYKGQYTNYGSLVAYGRGGSSGCFGWELGAAALLLGLV